MARSKCNVEMAEDCTQEAFIVLYKRMKKGEEFQNPKAFLYKTANNFLLKALDKRAKKVKSETSIDTEDFNEPEDDSEKLYCEIDYQELTRKINEILNDEEKRMFEYRFIDDMKITDIAEIMELNEATCATKLHRLRNKLKCQLTDFIGKGV